MNLARKLARPIVLVATALVLWLTWPQSFGGRIAYVRVDGHSMDPTLHNGDIVVVRKQAAYAVGDVVTYRIPQGEFGAGARVVHRLVAGDGWRSFTTRGDNRTIDDPWHPRAHDVVGRLVTRVPGAGYLMGELSRPVNLGALCAALTVLVLLLPERARSGPGGPDADTPDLPQNSLDPSLAP